MPLRLLLDIVLLPVVGLATLWVRRREVAILRAGVALTPGEITLARTLGVRAPQRVRVMAVPRVPLPLHHVCQVLRRAGCLPRHIAGMTLGYGIVLRADCAHNAALLAHELVHVRQYERLGGVSGFLRQYLSECVWPGYPYGALEIEARAGEIRAGEGSTRAVDVIPYTSRAVD